MGSSAWRMEADTAYMDQSSSILGHRIGPCGLSDTGSSPCQCLGCSWLPPWVPQPPATSKNSAHHCFLAVKVLREGRVLNNRLPVPRKSTTASREPLGDLGVAIRSGPDTPGIMVPPVLGYFFCISKSRLGGRRQWVFESLSMPASSYPFGPCPWATAPAFGNPRYRTRVSPEEALDHRPSRVLPPQVLEDSVCPPSPDFYFCPFLLFLLLLQHIITKLVA